MLNFIQITLLVLVGLAGIPAGVFVAQHTWEELKPGRKWFKIIAITSVAIAAVSLFMAEGDTLALILGVSAFTFFLAAVPFNATNKNNKGKKAKKKK